jgi:hypothetical protein
MTGAGPQVRDKKNRDIHRSAAKVWEIEPETASGARIEAITGRLKPRSSLGLRLTEVLGRLCCATPEVTLAGVTMQSSSFVAARQAHRLFR